MGKACLRHAGFVGVIIAPHCAFGLVWGYLWKKEEGRCMMYDGRWKM